AAFETIATGAGTFSALRLETILNFSASTETNAPLARHTTNWLAYGVGLVAFGEHEEFASGPARHRSGELTSYNVLTPYPHRPTVNVGANPLFTNSVAGGASPLYYQWWKNGSDLAGATNESFVVYNAQAGDAGTYGISV